MSIKTDILKQIEVKITRIAVPGRVNELAIICNRIDVYRRVRLARRLKDTCYDRTSV